MFRPGHALAALAFAAAPGGPAHAEPPAQPFAPDLQRLPIYTPARLLTGPAPGVSQHAGSKAAPRFGLTAYKGLTGRPGTASWLFTEAGEPLAASYAAPQAGRKEYGFGYSSDGAVSSYIANRLPYAGAQGAGESSASPIDSSPAAYLNTKGAESPAVTALIAKLRTKGLKLEFDDAWRLDVGARSREYSNSALNSRVGHIMVQRYWGSLVTAYGFQIEKRGGWNVAPSQSLQVGYAFTRQSSLGVSYATGSEIAFFGARGMLKTEMHSFALRGQHAFASGASFTFDAGYYDHGDLPAHKAIRFAYRRSF
jgi:YaiO family outer membrane protein